LIYKNSSRVGVFGSSAKPGLDAEAACSRWGRVEDPIAHENLGQANCEKFDRAIFWPHSAREKRKRGLQGVPAGFIGKKRRHMVDELKRRGINGNDGTILRSGNHGIDDEIAE
jgi:hypothetical protein